MSIAGGMARAAERAYVVGCTALQVFTKSSNQWAAKPLDPDDVEAFHLLREEYGIRRTIAHNSYLINLASPDPALWKRSKDAFVLELERCRALGIGNLVFHPGAHMGEGEEKGIARVATALNRIHDQTPGIGVHSTLEVTAGQGSCLGHRFEHLAEIIDQVEDKARMAVCLDTCHLLAAGYDIRTEKAYRATMRRLNATVGIDRVQAIHVNDSKKGLGSRVDRHECIGQGEVGEEAFRCLLNDRRLRKAVMVLETPKGEDEVKGDAENLRRLVALVKGKVKVRSRDKL